jgi:hypothetical protein
MEQRKERNGFDPERGLHPKSSRRGAGRPILTWNTPAGFSAPSVAECLTFKEHMEGL